MSLIELLRGALRADANILTDRQRVAIEGFVNRVPVGLVAQKLDVNVNEVRQIAKVAITKVKAAERLTSGR